MKTVIYLIRHSKSLSNKDIIFNNKDSLQIINEKLPLSSTGEEYAKKLAEWEEFNNIDYIYTSNYVRTMSTGKYISSKANIPIIVDERLNERKIGDSSLVSNDFWLEQLYDKYAKAPDGESRNEVCERMLDFINDMINNNKGKIIVAVSHAMSITSLLMSYCELKSASLEGKQRHLIFNNKDVINGSINTPDVFKLSFEDNNIIDIKLIRKN